uniref:Uncharacterized protein n=1 Tax=Anguilla anguilla TaxID=7936 RepID=A0A0E9SHW6_ANGAN
MVDLHVRSMIKYTWHSASSSVFPHVLISQYALHLDPQMSRKAETVW